MRKTISAQKLNWQIKLKSIKKQDQKPKLCFSNKVIWTDRKRSRKGAGKEQESSRTVYKGWAV